MASRTSRARLLGSALLAAAAVAAIPASAIAYDGESAFYPEFTPPVYPGSSPAVVKDGWKLTGNYRASQTLIAPRWVMASGHALAVETWGYNSPLTVNGQQAIIKKVFTPTQTFDESGEELRTLDTTHAADISLVLLDRPMPAPNDGFPRLMSDPITPDLTSSLRGSVLWNGMGTDWIENWNTPNAIVHPRAGWTRPNGLPLDGEQPLSAVDGDSGSIGLWYPTATARPVISSVSTSPETMPRWSKDSRFTAKLKPSTTENYATVADWIKGKVAAERALDPTLGAPEWVTLADLGSAPSTLVPPAPRKLRISEATPTSLTVSWTHSTETRIPRSGYRVRLGNGTPIDVPAGDTSYTFSGLTTGTEYTVSVKAFNGNGESNVHRKPRGEGAAAEPDSVRFTTHANPTSVVSNVAITTAMTPVKPSTGWQVDYCSNVSWTMPTAPAGEQLDGLSVYFGSDEIVPQSTTKSTPVGQYGTNPATYSVDNGTGRFTVCGLTPGATHGVQFNTVWAPQLGPTVLKTTKVPTGPTPGAALPQATNLTLKGYRTITNDKTDYCIRASWQAAAAPAGAVARYTVVGSLEGFGTASPITATEYVKCGLDPETDVTVQVWTQYEGTRVGFRSASDGTPAGAPLGTAVPKPTNLSLTTGPANNAGTVDYCITATWQLADLAGFTRIDTAGAWNADASSTAEAAVTASGTSRTSKLCGLQPGTAYTVSAGVIYTNGSFVPYEATATITTPSGAAPGTEWEAPNNLRVTQQLVSGQRCATLMWAAPAPVDGFPVLKYNAYLVSDDGTYSAIAYSLSALQGTKQFCGLPASKAITATVQAVYRSSITAETSLPFTSNA